MKRILPFALLYLLPILPASASVLPQDEAEEEVLDAPDDADDQGYELNGTHGDKTPAQVVRAFVNEHGTLRYTIYDYRKTLGEYTQKTKIITLSSGREVLDLADTYFYVKAKEPRTLRTRAWINKYYDLIELSGDFGTMGSMAARQRDGRIIGKARDGKPYSFEAPEHMMTRDLFQRGFYSLPTVVGDSITVDVFALENTETNIITNQVNVIFRGIEDVVAQGVTYSCRRYVARATNEKRASQYWFDAENRLIMLKTGMQTWELIPKGQAEPLPVTRKPNPMRHRKETKEQEEGDEGDDDEDQLDEDGEEEEEDQ